MRRWSVPFGTPVSLPRGVQRTGVDPSTGETMFRHDRLRKYYRVTQGLQGYFIEEWDFAELDGTNTGGSGCGGCG